MTKRDTDRRREEGSSMQAVGKNQFQREPDLGEPSLMLMTSNLCTTAFGANLRNPNDLPVLINLPFLINLPVLISRSNEPYDWLKYLLLDDC